MKKLKIILKVLKVFKWLIIGGGVLASVVIILLQEELVIQGTGMVEVRDENLQNSMNGFLDLDDEMKFTVESIQSELPPTPALKFAIVLSAFLICGYLAFILHIIIQLVEDIKNSEPFSHLNVMRLKQIAWLIILAPFLKMALEAVYLFIIGTQYDLPNELTFSYSGDIAMEAVAIGLLLYAIAVAFGEGLKLKHEQDLTI